MLEFDPVDSGERNLASQVETSLGDHVGLSLVLWGC